MDIPENIPDSGAVFTFGNSRFSDNNAGCFWLKNDVIISASCGDEHTAFVTESGKLYVFGSNDWGQLGLGHTHQVNKPTCVKSLKIYKVSMVACGRNHTIACTADNKLFVFGNNSDSQLGIDDIDSSNLPLEVDVSNCGTIKQIDAGADFSVALTDDGNVYVWGSNVEGQLGLGSEINEAIKPTLIQSLCQVKYVACGYYHMAAVTESGDLYTFGEDEYGKLGEREDDDNCIPSKIKTSTKVVVVACGGSHTAFISNNGDLYTMGDGAHGELGNGENVLQSTTPLLIERLRGHNVAQVSCGENFTCAITKKGRLYTFGDGRHGKLAVNDENFTNQFRPFRCTKFDKLLVSFAECGGCHMVAYARCNENTEEILDTDSEGEDPMLTINGNINSSELHASRKLNGFPDNQLTLDEKVSVNLSRSLSAREKRRQGRENLKSQTLPPLKTLRPIELVEAARSLPKPTQSQKNLSFVNEWSHVSPQKPQKDTDTVSEISAFNKVHTLQQAGDINTLTPIHTKPREVKEINAKTSDQKEESVKNQDEPKQDDLPETESTPVIQVNGNDQNSYDKITPPSMEESEDEEDADDEEETGDELSEADDVDIIEECPDHDLPTEKNKDDKEPQVEKESKSKDAETSNKKPQQEKVKKEKFRWFKKGDKKDKTAKSGNVEQKESDNTNKKQDITNDLDKVNENIKPDEKNQASSSKTEQTTTTSDTTPKAAESQDAKLNAEGETSTEQKDSTQTEQAENKVPVKTNPNATKKTKSRFCSIL